jgi:hypothetical protein
MATQMWFGNERRFQWVPCPATGMEISRSGVAQTMQYDNGRLGFMRTHQKAQSFGMNFPVQNASGLEGLDVFSKYDSGFYGDLDDYPLFFADPMNYDQNLLAPNFAAPGLFESGWASIADRTNSTFTNLATNPSAEVATTGWADVDGTSGVASGARSNAVVPVAGQWAYRVTWSTGTSAVTGGFNYTGTPAEASQYHGAYLYVYCSKIQRLQLTMRYRNSGGTSIGTSAGSQIVVAATTWTKLEVTPNLAPVGTVTVDLEVAAVSGTSGSNWANGNHLSGDAVMIYKRTTGDSGTYFDGTTQGAAWTGTAHASSSRYMRPTQPVSITDTPANSYNLPARQATFTIVNTLNAYPNPDMTFGEVPYALIPIPPGYTLWLGASGSATGTAVVRVHAFNSPGNPDSPANSSTLTLLSSTGAVRLNASFSGSSYQYVKVFLQRTSTVTSTITLSAMMAQLWPTGVTPVLSTSGGSFIAGRGHRGLKFADNANVESYVMADRHLKGLSTQLVEAQDKG